MKELEAHFLVGACATFLSLGFSNASASEQVTTIDANIVCSNDEGLAVFVRLDLDRFHQRAGRNAYGYRNVRLWKGENKDQREAVEAKDLELREVVDRLSPVFSSHYELSTIAFSDPFPFRYTYILYPDRADPTAATLTIYVDNISEGSVQGSGVVPLLPCTVKTITR